MQGAYIYWLVIEPTAQHMRKQQLLEERGFQVVMFKTISAVLGALSKQRAGYYIIGDEGSQSQVLKAIAIVGNHPEMQGAKLILSLSQDSAAVLRAAACEGFRDALPIGMGEKEWVQRLLFSIAAKSMVVPTPEGARPFEDEAVLYIPARVSLMNEERLLIESRFTPREGASIDLLGPIPQAMGLNSLKINIGARQTTHLRYRFSEAVFASWADKSVFDTPSGGEVKKVLRSFDRSSRPRIFLAISSPALRSSLLRHLEQSKYDVHTALQKRTLIEDPKFFSPHIVFIEEPLCIKENLKGYAAMVALLSPDSSVVVVGSDNHRSAIEGVSLERKIFFLKIIPLNLRELVERDFLPGSARLESLENMHPIAFDHEFSCAELAVKCHLKAIHPVMAQLSFPYKVGKFGLARASSPYFTKLWQRDPWVKIMKMQDNPCAGDDGDRVLADCYFCDLTDGQRRQTNDKSDKTDGEQDDNAADGEPHDATSTVAITSADLARTSFTGDQVSGRLPCESSGFSQDRMLQRDSLSMVAAREGRMGRIVFWLGVVAIITAFVIWVLKAS